MSAITRPMAEALVGVQIERTGPRWGAVDERWAIGRLGAGHGEGRRVLVPIDGHGLVATCDPAVSVDVPAELAVETALLVPLVVETLRACDTLGAEIGTAVAISVAMPWSPILSAAARWYGAVPIQIGGGVDGEAEIDLSDADAVPRFTKKLAGYSAVAAVEFHFLHHDSKSTSLESKAE